MTTTSPHSNAPGGAESAAFLLAGMQRQMELAGERLASACAPAGQLDAARLDQHQHACYELAWASANLLAAKTALAHAQGDLDGRLALLFAADALEAAAAQLANAWRDTGAEPAELLALVTSEPWAALRQAAARSDVMAQLGHDVADGGIEIGQVVLDEATAMAQEAFRRFGAEVVAPQAEHIHRQDLTVPETLLGPMRDMGLFGLSIPESYGGTATDGREDALIMIAVTEALSEASLAAAGSLITRPEILARALMAGGTAAQKSHWLPRIAAGDPLCAIAITEPDYGSDVASLKLAGTRTEGGWLLNGAKTWCTFAGKAGVLMVVTRTNPDTKAGHRGLSLLLVEKPSYDGHEFCFVQPGGGQLRGRAIPTIGYRGMHSFDLFFEDFFVPDSHVVGEAEGLGKGFYYTMAGMVGGRMQTAARACGVMRAALRDAIRYAQDRKVFGAPLADMPLTRVKIARMAARYAACRQLAYAVGRMAEHGEGAMEASQVKLLACRSAEWVTRESLQIHGGMGYAEESAISRYFVDARVLSIFEGAEETLALKVIARSLLADALARGQQLAPSERAA